jgi:RNA polymerase sigma factor (sigma-70 family)
MSQLLRPLIDLARSGDRPAKEALAGCVDRFVRLFSGSLTGQVRRTCGSTIDFVNEGLAEAIARLPEFEFQSDEEFYGWVARIIRSRMLDAVRREGRKKRAGRPLPLEEGLAVLAAAAPSPSEVISQEELRGAVRQAILDVQLEHPQEMEVVLLKLFEGESWKAIQDSLGLSSEKRARTLCARGIDLLRPRIQHALGDGAFEEYLGL